MPEHKPDIVVVDDDANVSQAIERLLSAAGFHPVAFSSAEALLETSPPTPAACLVFDIYLPGLSGFELHQCLVESGTKSPVIFMTAHDDPAGREQARQAGAVAYLVKPFSGRELVAVIAKALEHA